MAEDIVQGMLVSSGTRMISSIAMDSPITFEIALVHSDGTHMLISNSSISAVWSFVQNIDLAHARFSYARSVLYQINPPHQSSSSTGSDPSPTKEPFVETAEGTGELLSWFFGIIKKVKDNGRVDGANNLASSNEALATHYIDRRYSVTGKVGKFKQHYVTKCSLSNEGARKFWCSAFLRTRVYFFGICRARGWWKYASDGMERHFFRLRAKYNFQSSPGYTSSCHQRALFEVEWILEWGDDKIFE